MTRVLVTGGGGFVGNVLCRRLLNLNFEVLCMDNFSKGDCDAIIPLVASDRFEFIEGDVTNVEDVKKAIDQSDAVIHLAGLVGAPACKKAPYMSYAVNYEGTKNVVENLNGKPIVFASTGSVYGALEETCTEDSPLNPQSEYGIHKKMAEDLVTATPNSVSLRFATGFGLSPSMRVNLLVNDFCFRATHEKFLNIFEGHARRTFIHVEDMARAFTFCLRNIDKLKYKVYNCGSNDLNCTKKSLAEMVASKVKCDLTFNETDKDPDSRDYEVDYSRLTDEGFTCERTLEDGIDELIKVSPILRVVNRYV